MRAAFEMEVGLASLASRRRGISAVLDMGEMRKAEQARLVADLLDYLFTRNRDPLWLLLEEADTFAPQQPMGDLTRVLGEVDRIARRGRNFGFRLISITQRPAKLNKDVLTQLSTLIAMGVTSPKTATRSRRGSTAMPTAIRPEKFMTVSPSSPLAKAGYGRLTTTCLTASSFRRSAPSIRRRRRRPGDIRITAPVLASADLAKITKQIQAIQATQDGKAKRSAKAGAAKPPLVPVQRIPASRPKVITATAPSQLGAAILAARTAAGLSQIELAAKLKTAQANIARLEKAGSIPSTSTLHRVAKATGHKLTITFSRDS